MYDLQVINSGDDPGVFPYCICLQMHTIIDVKLDNQLDKCFTTAGTSKNQDKYSLPKVLKK